MEQLTDWIAHAKIPVGTWGKIYFSFLTTHFEWFFSTLSDGPVEGNSRDARVRYCSDGGLDGHWHSGWHLGGA